MSKAKRIGIVTSDMGGGGIWKSILSLLSGLDLVNFKVDLLLYSLRGDVPSIVQKPFRLFTLNTRYWSSHRHQLRRFPRAVQINHLGPRWSPRFISGLRAAAALHGCGLYAELSQQESHAALAISEYLRNEKPHALVSHLENVQLAALAGRELASSKAKIIVVEHSALSHRTHASIRLAEFIHSKADCIIACSKGVAADIEAHKFTAKQKISTIYNPVVNPELQYLAMQPADHPWLQDTRLKVIITVCRLAEIKNLPILLRAFARLEKDPSIRLLIVGEGPERTILQKLINTYGLNRRVDMPGWRNNPYALMRAARLFVLCSRQEALPNALIEALACGCPVVSTDCPHGPREILEDGKWGALVPVGDDVALADAMKSALQENPDRDALRERAGFFSVERAVRGYEEIVAKGGS